MRIRLLFPLLCVINTFCYGQEHKIAPELQMLLRSGSMESLEIAVAFEENVDFELLGSMFSEKKIPVDQRPAFVEKALKQTAESSQKQLIGHCLAHFNDKIYKLYPSWMVNRIFMECHPSVIPALASFPEVALIYIESGQIIFEEPVFSSAGNSDRSPGSAEPGLYAINAPRMWELGYTGRGRMVYNYDTGVWPDHPAFADRFIGKRFPLSQSWIGYSSPVPTGEINSHGTHVLGTMAGLVSETSDTLGVAVNAYWIANDFVGTSVQSLPSIEAMISAFEWALNPDGDPGTTYDVPDVINNSWRWYDAADKVHCGEGIIVDLMNAIEAAGIANVFAGGNFGPDNTTISSPQRINTSKVNTFSVGSVNANLNYPYPISDFSSRGPTQCDGSDFERIHPQVVAPGEMVRSAWGTDAYNTISGTSMACPHVSGAVLLLKEAFPYLAGEKLLWALYETAIDFGETGEDNTFGNGLIDVFAAFQYLSQTFEPVDPKNALWDLSIDEISGLDKNNISCENVIFPIIHFSNKGINPIDSFIIKYWFTGRSDTMELVLDTLMLPAGTFEFHFEGIELDEPGWVELNIDVRIPGVLNEYDLYNNRHKTSVRKYDLVNIPFLENFETDIQDSVWWQFNPDYSTTWQTVPLTGHGDNLKALTMQFFNYSPRAKQLDQIVLLNVPLPDSLETVLSFDLAYAPFLKSNPEYRDTFRVRVLDNCDFNRSLTVYEKAGDSLVTYNSITLNFQPKNPGQWRKEIISLKEFAGSTVSLVFETVNQKWNNLYLDNIRLDTNSLYLTAFQPDKQDSGYFLYPNPANDHIRIKMDEAPSNDFKICLYNSLGELIREKAIQVGDEWTMNVADLNSGIYFLQIEGQQHNRKTVRFVKN